jgi:predicted  nucleic acid-binding Zn ribbon protein
MTTSEAYAKLRPPQPTPTDEICGCDAQPPIKLMRALSYNPIHCVACNQEVPPEYIGLSAQLAQAVANWNQIASATDRLWLDSGAYESWAQSQLSDLASPVNVEGRRLAGELDGNRRCYYWCFVDSETAAGLVSCPRCHRVLRTMSAGPFKQAFCDECSLIGPAAEP